MKHDENSQRNPAVGQEEKSRDSLRIASVDERKSIASGAENHPHSTQQYEEAFSNNIFYDMLLTKLFFSGRI